MKSRYISLLTIAMRPLDLRVLIPFWIRSNYIGRLSKLFAERYACSEDQVFLFGAARMGLFSLLKSIRTSTNDEVVVAGYTCMVVPNAVKFAGFKINYADINLETLTIEPDRLWPLINEYTKAVIVPHNFGIPAEFISIIRDRFPQILIVEDCAHSSGSATKAGHLIGTLGDASFFSFEYSKPFTTGMGGALIVRTSSVAKRMHVEYEKLSYYPLIDRLRIRISVIALFVTSIPYFSIFRRAVIALLRRAHILYSSPAAETRGEIPENYPVKMDPVAASLGYLQFRRIQEIEVIRKKLAEKYFQCLRGIDGLRLYHSPLYDMVRFPVLVVSNDAESTVLKIRQRVSLETGVETGDWFNDVVHPKGGYRFDYNQGQCPVGEYVSARMFNLPMNSMVLPDDDQLQHIRTIILQELSAQQVSGQNCGMAGINL